MSDTRRNLELTIRRLQEEIRKRQKAEERLKTLNETLEQKIDAGTAEARANAQDLAYAKIRIDTILKSAPNAILTADENGIIETANPAAARLFGYPPFEFTGLKIDQLIPFLGNRDAPVTAPPDAEAVAHFESEGCRKDGSTFPVRVSLNVMHLGSLRMTTAIIHDITERKKAEAALAEAARQIQAANKNLSHLILLDPLTELFNRQGLQQILSHEIHWLQRGGANLLVLLADLDDFKEINDRFGYGVGDLVLKETSQRLKAAIRSTDYAGRVGGDEFLIFLPQTKPAEACEVAEKIRLMVSSPPIAHGTDRLHITVSLGIVAVDPDVFSVDELLAEAHFALHQSKCAGKNRIVCAWEQAPERVPDIHFHTTIRKRIRKKAKIDPVFHPIYALEEERIIGYEILSRADDPSFPMPSEFFRLSQEVRLLTQVDRQCFNACLAAAATLAPQMRRHINLFPVTASEIPVSSLLKSLPSGARKNHCIEISQEQIVGEPSYLVGPVQAFRQAGMLIAMDDVGFGHSCLESLILLEPEIVKIDRKCIDGISQDAGRRRSLSRLLKMAQALGAEVIAEGIETAGDLATLRKLGVRYGQGFLWGMPSKPQPPQRTLAVGKAVGA